MNVIIFKWRDEKMESEMLKIFDEHGIEIGTAPRSEVHKAGHWHETFHCWFIERIAGIDYLYFQIRSSAKKDYPNLLDITAAGHILADENFMDGLREVKEELGIDLTSEKIIELGIIKDSLINPEFIDKELCHVYLYDKHVPFDNYTLQKEEVSGIVRARIDSFEKLWFEEMRELNVDGFQIDDNGAKKPLSLTVVKNDFVPHEDSYIKKVIKGVRNL
jgi:isopentenyldiphosphate isomerase